jgi:glycosyltransferase involved in cell wall biosynthesis
MSNNYRDITNPSLSIIVPVYNVEQYLDQCLQSILRQSKKDIEIICINDGSTDSSLGILQKYANLDKRIIVIDKQNE